MVVELNNQTKKKIKELKEMIEEEIPLKEIIKQKFGSSPRLIKWLEKNYLYFNENELEYLEYKAKIEIIEEISSERKQEEKSEVQIFKKNIVLDKSDITQMTEKQRAKLLMSDDVIELLITMLDREKNSKGLLDIPIEYTRLKDIKIKNCRISDSIYKNFVKCCEKNNYTITTVLNYILDEFSKKHK